MRRRAVFTAWWQGSAPANHEGRAFHATIGYREVAVLPEVGRKFGKWLDLALLIKHL